MLLKEVKECRCEMLNIMRGPFEISEPIVILTAYLLYLSYDIKDTDITTLNGILSSSIQVDEQIKYLILDRSKDILHDELWTRLLILTKKYKQEHFKKIILMRNDDIAEQQGRSTKQMHTPVSIEKLALSLLDANKSLEIADLCCGGGDSTLSLALQNPKANVYGYELNSQAATSAMIRAKMANKAFSVKQCDIFSLVEDGKKFDRIFMDHPFGIKVQTMGLGKRYYDEKSKNMQALAHVRSGDWVFNSLIMDLLKENGRAVTIMTNGSTWNYEDQFIREMFIGNGYIECIIALPPAMYHSTNIPTTMIVLNRNKTNQRGIYMVDATNCCTKGRRKNEFTDNDIEKIVAACYGKETSIGRFVPLEELYKNSYVLNPGRYLAEKVDIKNGVRFDTVIKKITRGANLRASELDKLTSKSHTECQYLMLSNIQNGIITKELPYLTEIEDNLKKYCISDHSLLISKNSEPYKVAVAEVEEGKTILANGNLYVIELDEEQVDPYFLKAFFESDKGKAQLHSITVGTTIPCIGVKDLKAMLIPLPSIDEQHRIAQKYLYLQDEIKILNIKQEKTLEKIAHVFDDEEVL